MSKNVILIREEKIEKVNLILRSLRKSSTLEILHSNFPGTREKYNTDFLLLFLIQSLIENYN